jgi:hypothetical protein
MESQAMLTRLTPGRVTVGVTPSCDLADSAALGHVTEIGLALGWGTRARGEDLWQERARGEGQQQLDRGRMLHRGVSGDE